MGANEIQIFVIKTVKNLGENCVCRFKKYTIHSCLMLLAYVLYNFFPSVFIILAYSSPLVGFAFLVHKLSKRTVMERPKVKTVGPKSKRWKELQSRRSFKSLHRVHVPKQHNESSFMQDPPSARQNATETNNKLNNKMSSKDNKDIVSSTTCNNKSADKQPLIDEKPKPKPKEIQDTIPEDHSRFNEEYRKSTFDNDKKLQETLNVHEEKEKQNEHRIKTVRWLDEAEKSLMDLGVSEDERTKRLESLMERRKSKKLSSFQVRTTGIGIGMGMGIGNSSCGQISSLNIPKKNNPFLADSSSDPDSPTPVSAPSYMVKSNPFDLPYDPHEEKPILTGDNFEDDHKKEPMMHFRNSSSKLGKIEPPEIINYKQKTFIESDFTIKQLPSGRLVTSTVEKDEKQPQKDGSNPNHDTNDNNHAKKEENKEDDKKNVKPHQDNPSSSKVTEKVVDIPDEESKIEKNTKEKETAHEISINESTSSSSSCSDDERIMRPNKEAILHCLSMSRMRIISQGKSFHRHAETFDCGPSALFDKSKTDCFFFGGNKKLHYASMNSIASDMQVEVSEVGSPLHERLHPSMVDLCDSFDADLNDVRLSDVDDFSDRSSVESEFSRTNHDSDEKTDSYEKIEERCTFEKL